METAPTVPSIKVGNWISMQDPHNVLSSALTTSSPLPREILGASPELEAAQAELPAAPRRKAQDSLELGHEETAALKLPTALRAGECPQVTSPRPWPRLPLISVGNMSCAILRELRRTGRAPAINPGAVITL